VEQERLNHKLERATMTAKRIAMMTNGHAVTDARVTYKEAVTLAEAGYAVAVFGMGSEDGPTVPGVKLVPIAPWTTRSLLGRAMLLPALFKAVMRWRPDIIVCHEPESASIGLIVKYLTGAKLHFDVHELYHESLSFSMRPLIRPVVRGLATTLLRFLGRQVDWISVVSPAIRDFYLPLHKHKHVDIIYNSPRPEEFPQCNQDPDGPIRICHEGNLSRNRGMIQMLQALAIATEQVDLRLVLLGKVVLWEQALFDQTLESIGVGKIVEGPQWINYKTLGAAIAESQIGIIAMQPTPNNYLGLSNKLFNYMACGMPLIAPRGSASADLIEKHDSGLVVDTTSPEDIADAMVTLITDVSLRKKLGANGREAIANELGWHVMARRLLEIHACLMEDNETTPDKPTSS
jgi:glycosyltransferase involved in cell wall biosynthesis